MKKSPQFDVLLLSTHGIWDKLYDYKLVFKTSDPSLVQELYPYEILNLPLNARLAILSSCESGLGSSIPGEGMNSMARAFFEAGCPSVIMSLWQIPDTTTSQVMIDFYHNLSKGYSIDEGLREAKLDYINSVDRRLAHPNNWAGLITMGITQPLVSNKIIDHWSSKLMLVLLASLIFGEFLKF